MVTRIQALRMAAANKLRKRIDYDLAAASTRELYRDLRLRLFRKEQQEREALTEPFQPTGDHWLDAHYRVTREGRAPEQDTTKHPTEFVHRPGDHWVDEDGLYHIVAFPGGG